MLGLGLVLNVKVRISVLWVRAVSACIRYTAEHQPVASLTAIQVAVDAMFFIKHDVYRADGAAVQISLLTVSIFTFTEFS